MKAAKSMIALAAAAVFGVAFAQSTPPNTASKDPATGAGQRSTQNTPMGATGTPGGGATMSSGGTGSGTSMGASSTTDTSAAATTSSSSGTHKAKKKSRKHKARSDRG